MWPTLSREEAAERLGVSPEVLVQWEARYGYPRSCQWATKPGRTYSRTEIAALSASLETEVSITSAIAIAQAELMRRRQTTRRARTGRPSVRGQD
jgi:hypothetical protein